MAVANRFKSALTTTALATAATGFLAGCGVDGGEEEQVAYCTDEEGRIVDDDYCDRGYVGPGLFFLYVGAFGRVVEARVRLPRRSACRCALAVIVRRSATARRVAAGAGVGETGESTEIRSRRCPVPLSVAETCARIAAELDRPEQPFRYTCSGDRIVGTWDVADVSYSSLVAGGTIDVDYSITVTLDERSGTYGVVERTSDGRTEGGLRGDGTIGFSRKKEVFRGRSTGKQWGGGMALRASSHGQPGPTWSYSFETSRIKQPLLDLLASAGWQPERTGFLARLFAR